MHGPTIPERMPYEVFEHSVYHVYEVWCLRLVISSQGRRAFVIYSPTTLIFCDETTFHLSYPSVAMCTMVCFAVWLIAIWSCTSSTMTFSAAIGRVRIAPDAQTQASLRNFKSCSLAEVSVWLCDLQLAAQGFSSQVFSYHKCFCGFNYGDFHMLLPQKDGV